MIGMVEDPHLAGFFFALKGMMHSAIGAGGGKMDRNLRKALILDPVSGGMLLRK